MGGSGTLDACRFVVWVPNWPSTAVTWGITGQWPWGMILGRCGTRLLYLSFCCAGR
jgi:hypothetical protein